MLSKNQIELLVGKQKQAVRQEYDNCREIGFPRSDQIKYHHEEK